MRSDNLHSARGITKLVSLVSSPNCMPKLGYVAKGPHQFSILESLISVHFGAFGSESTDFYLNATVRNHHRASEMGPEGRYYPDTPPTASHKVASPAVEIQNGRIGTVSTFRGHCGSTRL